MVELSGVLCTRLFHSSYLIDDSQFFPPNSVQPRLVLSPFLKTPPLQSLSCSCTLYILFLIFSILLFAQVSGEGNVNSLPPISPLSVVRVSYVFPVPTSEAPGRVSGVSASGNESRGLQRQAGDVAAPDEATGAHPASLGRDLPARKAPPPKGGTRAFWGFAVFKSGVHFRSGDIGAVDTGLMSSGLPFDIGRLAGVGV